jgi:hypothetical protein
LANWVDRACHMGRFLVLSISDVAFNIQSPRCVFPLLFRKYPDDGQSPKTQYFCIFLYVYLCMYWHFVCVSENPENFK